MSSLERRHQLFSRYVLEVRLATAHKSWQCTLTKAEGAEVKKKKREAEKKKAENEAATSSA